MWNLHISVFQDTFAAQVEQCHRAGCILKSMSSDGIIKMLLAVTEASATLKSDTSAVYGV